ncbi:MAG: tetratricopeptide repeat protein [Pseudomonadota bacterium]
MFQVTDTRDTDFTCEDSSHLVAFDDVMLSYLSSKVDTMAKLKALTTTSDMPMAHCLTGYMMKMASDPRSNSAVDSSLKTLDELTLNQREAQHRDVLSLWAQEKDTDALAKLEALLDDYPQDMLALRIAHHLHFYTGDSDALCESVRKRLPSWSGDDPLYGFLLGMLAFGLEESGEYRDAEHAGREACERNPDDLWAAHAVMHVMQMNGRWVDGVQFADDVLSGWSGTNNFVYHLHWHKALLQIGRRDYDAALAIYDEHLAGVLDDDFYLDACNAASLLWRLQLAGLDVGDRWQTVADSFNHRCADQELVFASLHYLMAPAQLGDDRAVAATLQSFKDWSSAATSQGKVAADVGLELAHALVQAAQGDARGPQTIQRLRRDLPAIGGSWAQRELFKQLTGTPVRVV